VGFIFNKPAEKASTTGNGRKTFTFNKYLHVFKKSWFDEKNRFIRMHAPTKHPRIQNKGISLASGDVYPIGWYSCSSEGKKRLERKYEGSFKGGLNHACARGEELLF